MDKCYVTLFKNRDGEASLVFSILILFFLSGYSKKISQMPVILTPLHFDRDPLQKQPSCRRSVVVRTFITSDFMTGIPATPGNHIPEEVYNDFVLVIAR